MSIKIRFCNDWRTNGSTCQIWTLRVIRNVDHFSFKWQTWEIQENSKKEQKERQLINRYHRNSQHKEIPSQSKPVKGEAMRQGRYHPYSTKTSSGAEQSPQPCHTEDEEIKIEELKKLLTKSCYLTAQMFKQRDAEITRKAIEWDTKNAELKQLYSNMHKDLTKLVETSCCKHHSEEANRKKPWKT